MLSILLESTQTIRLLAHHVVYGSLLNPCFLYCAETHVSHSSPSLCKLIASNSFHIASFIYCAIQIQRLIMKLSQEQHARIDVEDRLEETLVGYTFTHSLMPLI